MEEWPICDIEGCNNRALVVMFEKNICGECTIKLDKIQKEKAFRQMQEDLRDGI